MRVRRFALPWADWRCDFGFLTRDDLWHPWRRTSASTGSSLDPCNVTQNADEPPDACLDSMDSGLHRRSEDPL